MGVKQVQKIDNDEKIKVGCLSWYFYFFLCVYGYPFSHMLKMQFKEREI